MKTLDAWIKIYEKRTRENFEPKKDFKLIFLPDRGFCEYSVDIQKRMVMIYQLCGDGKFWRDIALVMADLYGCNYIGTICSRDNIKAYIRFWGYCIDYEEQLPEGLSRYHCKQKTTQKPALCSPAWIDKVTGKVSYYVTWEV